MLQAIFIMLAAMVITVVTGFLISLLIQLLCRMVRQNPAPDAGEEAERIALALALALIEKRKL